MEGVVNNEEERTLMPSDMNPFWISTLMRENGVHLSTSLQKKQPNLGYHNAVN